MLREHDAEQFCYLTTTGRVTGRSHEIEIWFAFPPDPASATLYLLAGNRERSDWIKNLRHDPDVSVRLAGTRWAGTARVIPPEGDEDALARRLLCAKYQGWREGQPLSEWGRTALPVAVALAADAQAANVAR
jgi:deazaflavin-dependent oxidoreductase (nitroreductase family)